MRIVAIKDPPLVRPSRRPVDAEMLSAASAALAQIKAQPRRAHRHQPNGLDDRPSAVRMLVATVVVGLVAAGIALARIAQPAAASPCSPLSYVIADGSPAALAAEADVAFAAVGELAGITFVRTAPGTTQPAVVVMWSEPGALGIDDSSGSPFAGRASAAWVRSAGGATALKGSIHIDGSVAGRPGFAYADESGAVLLHEIGHVLGLSHGPDPSGVMYPVTRQRPLSWTPAEIAALQDVGRSLGCAG